MRVLIPQVAHLLHVRGDQHEVGSEPFAGRFASSHRGRAPSSDKGCVRVCWRSRPSSPKYRRA